MAGALAARAEALLSRHWWRPQATGLATLLRPAAALYGLLARRAAAAATPASLPVPVLVVGNLVAGGAGKTPAVIALVQALRAAGHRPGVISRGHGRRGKLVQAVLADSTAAQVGDEPLLLRRRCRGPVWVGADRSAAARALCAAHPEVDVLVSDDGLQHRRLARQAELLVFDDRGIGNGLLLPAGPLREPLPAQLQAHQRLLYTGARASTALPGALADRRLVQAWPLAAWHAGDAKPALPLTSLQGRRLRAAAGLGDPEKFFAMLDGAGLDIERLPLPDHFDYRALPWTADGGETVTTEKDATKLDPARAGMGTVWVLPLDFRLPRGLVDELLALLFPNPPPKTHE
jgi:tetraacyldisaccharide 4'-kinase